MNNDNNHNINDNNNTAPLLKKLKLKSGFSIIENEKLKEETKKLKSGTDKLKSETETSKEKFEIIFNTNPNPTLISSLEEGKIVQINQAFTSLFGFANEEVQGKNVLGIHFYDNPEERGRIIKELLQQGFSSNLEINYRNKNGEKIIGLYSGRLILLEGTPHIISVILDITLRKKAEEEIRKSEEKYRNLFRNATEMIIIIQDDKFKMYNPIFQELTGYTQEELAGFHYLNIVHMEDVDKVKNEHLARLEGKLIRAKFNFRLIKKDKSLLWVEINSIRIDWEGSNAVLCFLTDITERVNRENEVMYLSYHDQMTGLYNRRYYVEKLNKLNDSSESLPLSVVMADVNGLKLCNDAFGHSAGDNLLIEVANAIKNNCREEDIVSRIGGDEFVILLPKTNEKEAGAIVERIKSYIHNKKTGNVYMSVSFGYKTKISSDEDIGLILMQAEENMYRNKVMESDKMKAKTIQLIFKNLYGNNPWEERHSKSVSVLCEKLAIALNLGEQDKKDIKTAGLMHDIGKIALSKDLLMKPDELTDTEKMELMRHSEIGYHILKSTNEYARLAFFVIAHHERIDGKGYPKGLKGHEIPYQAKIISIAESYDTMINKKPYGNTMSMEEAILELKKNVGTQFDKHFTKVFIEKVLLKDWEGY